jgi:hypothetical protein
MLSPRSIFLFAVGAFAVLFLAWASLGYPTEITICEVANGTEKCGSHYVPVGIVRWVLFQLDRYGVLLTAIFTAFIAWFTLTLRRSTDKLWDAGERQLRHFESEAARARLERAVEVRRIQEQMETARIGANAADLSARAAIALELPIIRVEPEGLGFGTAQTEGGGQVHYCVIASLLFSNLGRTKAFPIEVKCGWTVGKELPKDPIYKYTKLFKIGLIFEPDPKTTPRLNLNDLMIDLPEGAYDQIRGKNIELWFYCQIGYLDFMQTRHEAGFCWRRFETFGGGGFIVDGTPSYNRKT